MSNDNKNSEFDDRPKMSTSTSKPEVMLATNNRTIRITKNVILGFKTNASMDNIKVSTKEAREFYNTYKDIYFKTPEEFKARHILVKDEKLAQKIINELKGLKGKALEKKFAELAKKYSIGPSASNGGELGWFNAKQMVPEFVNACKELKPGEITLKPVKTRYGYHVILLESKKKSGYADFNEVAPKIVEAIKREKLQKYLNSLKQKANVKILIK